jgi:hypothetical protein
VFCLPGSVGNLARNGLLGILHAFRS